MNNMKNEALTFDFENQMVNGVQIGDNGAYQVFYKKMSEYGGSMTLDAIVKESMIEYAYLYHQYQLAANSRLL